MSDYLQTIKLLISILILIYQRTMLFKKLCPILLVCCLLFACTTSNKITKNYANRYINQAAALPLKSVIHHISKDTTVLYLAIPTKILQADSLGRVHLRTTFKLYQDNKSTTVIDSFVLRKKVRFATQTDYLQLSQHLAISEGSDYQLTVYVADEMSKKFISETLLIRKSDAYNDQNYLLTDANTDAVIFDQQAPERTRIKAIYRKQTEGATVQYFKPSRVLALPPFVTNKTRPLPTTPDSTFKTKGSFTLDRAGLYFMQVHDTLTSGISLVCTEKNFPKLTQAADLVHALRYITQTKEFQTMIEATDPKAAVDSFWLKRAGSHDRGKVLIKEFYGRVQRANQHFTDIKAGWKTDRGLIFIIYGEPDLVTLNDARAYWEYRNERTGAKLSFTFHRQPNRFFFDYMTLQRHPNYENSWHKAVYEWRKGIIQNKSR